jgi:antitoxin FitA
MSTLTITLSEDRMTKLRRLAVRLGSSPEALVEEGIEAFLEQAEPNIRDAVQYVLTKNHELYQRLA